MLPIFLNLFAEPGKTQAGELALMVAIPCFLAVAIFGFGISKERDGGNPLVKYVSFAPLLIGCYIGWPYFKYANDKMVKNLGMIGGKSELAYNAALIVPAGLLVLFLVISFLFNRLIHNESRI
ncbi:MAG: hypothetical protein JNM85_11330 [Chthonomonas sp.]|nr:hypothetical protein [Chthonomonas sp.]